MKRIVIALSLLTIVCTNSSLAGDDHSYPEFLKSFYKTFTNAEKVSWTEVDGFIRIAFSVQGKENFAYYNTAGNLVVMAVPIQVSALPTVLQSALIGRFSNYSITEAYEFKKGKNTEYYVVLDNARKHQVLHSNGKRWTVFNSVIK